MTACSICRKELSDCKCDGRSRSRSQERREREKKEAEMAERERRERRERNGKEAIKDLSDLFHKLEGRAEEREQKPRSLAMVGQEWLDDRREETASRL